MPSSYKQKGDIKNRRHKVTTLYDQYIREGKTKTMAVLAIAKKLRLSSVTIYSDLKSHYEQLQKALIGKTLIGDPPYLDRPIRGKITLVKPQWGEASYQITISQNTYPDITFQDIRFKKEDVEKLSQGEKLLFYSLEETQSVNKAKQNIASADGK